MIDKTLYGPALVVGETHNDGIAPGTPIKAKHGLFSAGRGHSRLGAI